jgi:hypothetical protein
LSLTGITSLGCVTCYPGCYPVTPKVAK